jgi:Outer membrane efflux protein
MGPLRVCDEHNSGAAGDRRQGGRRGEIVDALPVPLILFGEVPVTCATAWCAMSAPRGCPANTAFQRVGVAQELSKEGDRRLQLSQGRSQLGLSSIVELSQAQLQQASAAIGYVNAQYQYKLALAALNFEMGVQP